MKVLRKLALSAGLAIALFPGAGSALPSASTAFVNGSNQISDDSGEVSVNNVGLPSTLNVGDYLVGMLGVTSFPTSGVPANTVNELTALFAIQITNIVAAAPAACGFPAPSCSTFTFSAVAVGFNAALAATGLGLPAYTNPDGTALAADTVAIVLEDPIPDFDRDGGTIATAFASAADGDVRLVLGLGGVGTFWNATGPADLLDFLLAADGVGIGSFSNTLTITAQDFAGLVLGPMLSTSGNVKPTLASPFTITDDATFTVNVRVIPEPGSLGLLGVALLAAGLGFRRRT